MRYRNMGFAAPHITPRCFLVIAGTILLAGPSARTARATEGTPAPDGAPAADGAPALERVYAFSDGELSGKTVFSPAAMQLAAIATDGSVRLIQPSGTVLQTLRVRNERLTALTFSPDGRTLVAGTDSGRIYTWDTRTGDRRTLATRPGQHIEYLGWLAGPDRCLVAAGSPATGASADTPNGAVIDSTGKSLWTFSSIVREGFATLCPAADGRQIAALGVPAAAGAACLLDGANGHIAARFTHPDYRGGWLSVCLAPDGKTLATGQAKDIVLWDLKTGKPLSVLKGHESWVVALAFSPDGHWLASGSRDGTARLWDVARGRPAGIVRFDNGARVSAVSFAPDGSLLMASTWADHVIARVPPLPAP